jgi:SAM-dependent methyltransferase
MRVLELGCAPGKLLAWVAAELHADVAGLDSSAHGIGWSRQLFRRLGLHADLRHEDALVTTFDHDRFDLVCSWGLIEHFADPRPLVRLHVECACPGGRALIGIPNYGGIYGQLQAWCDRDNLLLHNLAIMQPERLRALAPEDLSASVDAFPAGRLSPWLVNADRRFPALIARSASYALNGLGLLQPLDIAPLCPLLVLEIERR